ncbi:hypothetical protein NP493_788g01024 [Ridgeia piscesae]|uniref:Uncharacterized protein n=1 Tax=Ridgeia piscesae TaxID=27915 RepID=A0AAD9NLF1_RIDPI|nr:hypothetical protein NP493_788g01024 [Ridgeia piscesae]
MGLTRRVGPLFGWRDIHVMAHEFQQHPSGIIEMGDAQPCVLNFVIQRLFKTAARNFNTSTNRSIPRQHWTEETHSCCTNDTRNTIHRSM